PRQSRTVALSFWHYGSIRKARPRFSRGPARYPADGTASQGDSLGAEDYRGVSSPLTRRSPEAGIPAGRDHRPDRSCALGFGAGAGPFGAPYREAGGPAVDPVPGARRRRPDRRR